MLTKEREDYLKTIYALAKTESPVRTNSIARALNIEPASVTGAIKRLAELNYLTHEPYKGVTLTSEGQRVALQMLRRHRLIELFLIDSLGYTWDEVHDEAERLEHAVSQEFIDRIAKMLGNPDVDPHGAPIPSRDGKIVPRDDARLSDLDAGQRGIVSRVDDDDPDLLRYLASLNIVLGASISIDTVGPYGGPINIQVDGGETHPLGQEAAKHVFLQLATQ